MSEDSMLVRPARLEDAPAMARVMVDTYGPAHRGQVPEEVLTRRYSEWNYEISERAWLRDLREIAAGVSDRTCISVALDAGGEVVGVSMGGPTEHGRFAEIPEKTGEIFCLYVLPEHQGRGHGRRLVRATAAGLAQKGMRALLIRCLATNPPACRFYEALGGHAVGELELEEYGFVMREVVYLWPDTRALVAGSGSLLRHDAGEAIFSTRD